MMHDLTGFQRDLLFIVAGLDGPNGVTVKDELEQYYGQEVRHGRLYPNLDTLVEKGLVEKGQKDRRTNEYLLKESGRQEIESRLAWQTQHCPRPILEQTSGLPVDAD
jgi:PadR family transcriptional regulator PadR